MTQILPDFYSDIKFQVPSDLPEYKTRFKPLEISVLIDNLVSNSLKAEARNFKVQFEVIGDHLKISFIDDGKGLNSSISDIEKIFEKGVTTTKGSGLGLFFVKDLIEREMNGKVQAGKIKHGFNIVITL
jgi:signal transduction histidine kinase